MSSINLSDREDLGRWFSGSATSVRWRWFWLAALGMCVPMLFPYLLGMWDFEHYQYFPFVFLVVGYLVSTRSDGTFRAPRGWFGWTLVGLGLVGMLGSLLFPSAWLAGLSFVVLATACLASMSGEEDRSLAAVAVPLWMLIQLPVGLDRLLVLRLQRVTTELASVVLDLIAVPHAVAGNVIQLPSRELFVAEACSGIQSVFTLAFLACVIVAWNRRRIWFTPIYLIIALVLAVAGNVFRVTTIAVAEAWWGADLTSGWQHDLVGYVALALAGLMLLSFDQLVITVMHPAGATGGEMVHNPLIRAWNFLVADWRYTSEETGYGYRPDLHEVDVREKKESTLERFVLGKTGWYAVLAIVGVIALGAVTQAMRVEVNRDPEAIVRSTVLFDPDPGLLEGKYGLIEVKGHEFTRDGSEPRLGQNADVWDFAFDQHRGQIVVSQTYSGWHELCVCYENLEWDLVDREVCDARLESVDESRDGSYVTARFKRVDGQYGYLLFSAVNEDGTIPEAPSSWGAFGARFFSRLERHGVINQQNLAMVQLWLVTPERLRPDTIEEIQTDFVTLRTKLSGAMASISQGAQGEQADPVDQAAE